jgi:hypothetical protein
VSRSSGSAAASAGAANGLSSQAGLCLEQLLKAMVLTMGQNDMRRLSCRVRRGHGSYALCCRTHRGRAARRCYSPRLDGARTGTARKAAAWSANSLLVSERKIRHVTRPCVALHERPPFPENHRRLRYLAMVMAGRPGSGLGVRLEHEYRSLAAFLIEVLVGGPYLRQLRPVAVQLVPGRRPRPHPGRATAELDLGMRFGAEVQGPRQPLEAGFTLQMTRRSPSRM